MKNSKEERLVTQAAIDNLPEPVQRYMHYSNVLGKPWIHTVILRQSGRFRTGPDRPWMPMKAVQTYVTDPPSFIWKAQFRIGGLPLIRARDEYSSGRGHMQGKLAGLITLFDVRGDKLDQGAMMRYLSEMIWFPTAFLGENISWKAIDSKSAEVSFSDAGNTVTGRLIFDSDGKPLNFVAQRYREIDGDFSLDQWSTPITEYGTLAGLNLPLRGQAVWHLQPNDFAYVDVVVEEIQYNSAS